MLYMLQKVQVKTHIALLRQILLLEINKVVTKNKKVIVPFRDKKVIMRLLGCFLLRPSVFKKIL